MSTKDLPDHDSQEWPLVYIASPYTIGEAGTNVHRQIVAANILLDHEISPVVPLLNHFMQIVQPRPEEEWMQMDLAIVPKCDALLRLPGVSSGASREQKLALEHGIPVYTSIADLLENMGLAVEEE